MTTTLANTKGQQTRQRIIELAAQVFNKQGYAGTSIKNIMEATGLKKGGIYNHFENKEALAIAAFDYSISIIEQRLRSGIDEASHTVEKLTVYILHYEKLLDDAQLPGGCPIMNTAVEADSGAIKMVGLKQRAQGAMDMLCALIEEILDVGKQRGEVYPHVNPQNVATVIVSILEGALVMSRLYDDNSYLYHAIEHLTFSVHNAICITE